MQISRFLSGLAIAASLGCYFASLALPCFSPEDDPGIALLIFGPLGLFCGEIAWLANPCYLIATLCLLASLRHGMQSASQLALRRISVVAAFLGVPLAIRFAMQSSTYYGEHSVGEKSNITELLVGYWLWLTAMTLIAIASLTGCFLPTEIKSTQET